MALPTKAVALLLLVSSAQGYRNPYEVTDAPEAAPPRLRTQSGDLHLIVPPDGDVIVTGEGSPPRQVSLLARMASDADARVSINAAIAAVLSDTVTAAAQLEVDLRSSLDDLARDLRTEATMLSDSLSTAVSTEATTLSDSLSTAVSTETGALSTSIATLASRATADQAELSALKAALLPAKPGQYVLTPMPFTVRVAYEILNSAASPINLTFYVTNVSTASTPLSQWYRLTVRAPLQASSVVVGLGAIGPGRRYVMRVRGTSVVGAGPLSDLQTFRTPTADGAGMVSCTADASQGATIRCNAGQTCTLCTDTITIGGPSFMYVGLTGSYEVSSGSRMAIGVSFDGDNDDPYAAANQNKANGIGGSRQWEQVHSARSSPELGPGTHSITVRLRCIGGTHCSMRYVGMQGVWAHKKPGMQSSSCAASAMTISVGQNSRICRVTQRNHPRILALATVMGGINTAHLYVVPSFNNDGVGQAANQRYNPGHSYSRDYENFGSGRVRILGAGSSTTEAITQHGSGQYRFAGVSQLIIPTDGSRNQHFRCATGWSQTCSSTAGCRQCEVAFTVPYPVIAMAEFTGHYHTNNWCSGMIMFDNDETRWFGSGNTLVNKGRVMAAYGKSRRWENFSTKRFKLLPAGRHTASIWIRGNSGNQCYLNGMGMDGFWTKANPV